MEKKVYCAVLYQDCNPHYYYDFNKACNYVMANKEDYPRFNERDELWETKNGYVEKLNIE